MLSNSLASFEPGYVLKYNTFVANFLKLKLFMLVLKITPGNGINNAIHCYNTF